MIHDKNKLFEELKALGKKQVRENLNQGLYSSSKINLINEWLLQQSESKEESRFARKEERDEETLSIARDANDIAKSARNAAFEANSIANSALEEARTSNLLASEANKAAKTAKMAAIIAATGAIISAICAIVSIFKTTP